MLSATISKNKVVCLSMTSVITNKNKIQIYAKTKLYSNAQIYILQRCFQLQLIYFLQKNIHSSKNKTKLHYP